MRGTTIAIAILLVSINIQPIIGVKTAPPIIAITSSEEPIFVLTPSPRIESAKIVGNITDMKKLVQKTDHNPIHPGNNTHRNIYITRRGI